MGINKAVLVTCDYPECRSTWVAGQAVDRSGYERLLNKPPGWAIDDIVLCPEHRDIDKLWTNEDRDYSIDFDCTYCGATAGRQCRGGDTHRRRLLATYLWRLHRESGGLTIDP